MGWFLERQLPQRLLWCGELNRLTRRMRLPWRLLAHPCFHKTTVWTFYAYLICTVLCQGEQISLVQYGTFRENSSPWYFVMPNIIILAPADKRRHPHRTRTLLCVLFHVS